MDVYSSFKSQFTTKFCFHFVNEFLCRDLVLYIAGKGIVNKEEKNNKTVKVYDWILGIVIENGGES